MIHHFAAIALAYILDLLIGDPERWPHPVRGFGRLISLLETQLNKGNYRKLKGLLMVLLIILTAFISSILLLSLCYQFHPVAGVIVEAVLIATTVSANNLKKAAMEVYRPLKNGDLAMARKKLSYIVGRDTEQLTEGEITRGTVETIAENTSDGITAPFFWSFIGGAPLALVYRAVNTCDSMVGYQNDAYQAYGWASAKLDDVLNWIPARLTAFVMVVVNRPIHTTTRNAWSILFRDARKHKSPNSGWGEAAVAALLGIQLGGTNSYQGTISISRKMGEIHVPLQAVHILQTITIMRRTVFLFLLCFMIGGIAIELANTWI
ncbi:adenosylcobinamide-phosphate synthase [Virgibacillus phasianinus]|uniref:Cobalamin biosynthesis protein CobD n=1 Tax=Virgibacillus phasianinus TaxID=2017483 RepID=A0A220U1P7_9BACI|nr:adenosylcobinamide-phosphate synthase CbiB [Virgibacillus phasianinus]ASK61856.1 adenosylcobinamide-phosphate synthase [Virgibacillus phasianinus]